MRSTPTGFSQSRQKRIQDLLMRIELNERDNDMHRAEIRRLEALEKAEEQDRSFDVV